MSPAKASRAPALNRAQEWLTSPVGALAVLLVGVGISALVASIFNGMHPADSANLRAHQISSVSARDSATAKVLAYAQGLRVAAATGAVDIALPAPASECQLVAGLLHASCDASGVTITSALELAWSTPELFTLSPGVSGNRIDFSAGSDAGGSSLQLTVTDGDRPRLCTTRDLASANLTVIEETATVALPLSATSTTAACTGLVVHVVSPQPAGTSGFVLSRLRDASATLAGKVMVVSAQDLTLTLKSNAIDTGLKGPIEMDSDRSFALTTSGLPPNVQAPNDLQVPHATHVIDAGAERLQSSLSRYPWTNGLVSAASTIVAAIVLVLARYAPIGSRKRPANRGARR